MDYTQFIGKKIKHNDIFFTLIEIEFCKVYDCSKLCKSYFDICTDRRDKFNIKKSNTTLTTTVITLEIKNVSSNTFEYSDDYFKICDEDLVPYKTICPCDKIEKSNNTYFCLLPMQSMQVKLYFPQTKTLNSLYCQRRTEYLFGFNLSLKKNNLFIETQEKIADESLEKKLFYYLNDYISIRLTNKLFRSQKVHYENLIVNQYNNLLDKIKNGNYSSDTKEKLNKKLDSIMEEYNKQINEIGDNPRLLWEKQGNEGTRSDLGETFFRSSWEANLARVLNFKNIPFEYEKEYIELNGNLVYLPDFSLSEDIFIEVKGMWDNESLEKVDTFVRMFPNKKLQIIDYDSYPELYKIYTEYQPLPYWEKSSTIPKHEAVAVVGMRFLNDLSVLKEIAIGDKLNIELESNNPYDKYAIRVTTLNGKNLGHIEKRFATIYYQKLKSGMTFDVEIISIEPKVIKTKITRNNFGTNTLPVFLLNNND